MTSGVEKKEGMIDGQHGLDLRMMVKIGSGGVST